LAETQVPSPGYTGVYDEIAMQGFEYDVYEYFGELEYGSDSYWDARMKHLGEAGLGEKRKSEEEEGDTEARMVKKRRKDARGDVEEVRDNVLYVPFEGRLAPLPPVVGQDEGRFALLPDWKERFPERGSPIGKRRPAEMPAEMRKAAEEVIDEEEDVEDQDMAGDRDDGDEMETGEDGESEEDGDDEDGEEEEEGAGGLDQDLVMQVLRQKLADSRLGDVDESMFKDVIAKMMSGDGDSEDAVGGLASLLLGQEGGGGKAFEGFLAGQGVELGGTEEEEDDDDKSGVEDDEDEIDSRPTKRAKANPTRKRSQKPSTATSSSTTSAKPSKTPTTSRKRADHSETTALHESPLATRTSPTVIPSPLQPAIAAAASSTRPSRKRRAPSLDEPPAPQPPQNATASSARPSRKRRAPSPDEPSITQPPQITAETTSGAKPPAKRRRATPASSRSETPADEPESGPMRRRTTRSAAAAAGASKGRG
jgi:hypothetical protein